MKRKKIYLLVTTIVILFAFFLYSRSEQTFILNPYIDTVFAKDFTWEKFENVKTGMTKEEVINVIGQPLTKRVMDYPDPNECWQYSSDSKLYPIADFSWFSVQVCYTNEKLSSKPVTEFND